MSRDEHPFPSTLSPVLAQMMRLFNSEADRIEIWQRNRNGRRDVPKEEWDPRQRQEHKIYMDAAQLVYLVSLVEPEFKALVRRRIGVVKKQKQQEAPANVIDPSIDPAAAETPAD